MNLTSPGGPFFNLLDEDWILVLDSAGQLRQTSLTAVFEQADRLDQLVGDVPTQAFAIQRLLLAVMHRALGGPASLSDWSQARDDWGSAVRSIREYLDVFRDRFYLIHPEAPFFQVADLRTRNNEVSGLEKLIADVPNGEPYLTTRIGRGLERITWAEAARWLVHVHAFDPSGIRSGALGDPRVKAGKGYPIGPGWAGRIGGVALVGDSLRDTLLLNLVVPGDASDIDSPDDDAPPWERPPLGPGEEVRGGREPRGPVDLYTWQARRVRLVGDAEGVTGLVLSLGDPVREQNRQRLEPMTSWRYSRPQSKKFAATTYMPRRHDPERALWRGLAGLLPAAETTIPAAAGEPAPFLAPGVLRWAGRLRSAGLVPDRLVRLHAVGAKYGGNEATFEEIIDDQISVPVALLLERAGELARVSLDAVDEAEHAVLALSHLAHDIAAASGAASDATGADARAREVAYAELDAPFRHWLAALDPSEDPLRARTRWQVQARVIIYQLSRALIAEASPQAWVGRVSGLPPRQRYMDLGRAEWSFRRALAAALPLAAQMQAREPEEVSQ